uniref:Uncharacterized protein n=1 Tax=Salix viminalis TaxID=40686 RepID=A0A6N2K997_SALVM
MHSIFHGNDPKHHPTQAKISFQSTFLGGGVAKCPALRQGGNGSKARIGGEERTGERAERGREGDILFVKNPWASRPRL